MAERQEQSPSIARPRKAILVLGMHRSGTSALTGVIRSRGAALPNTLASPNNWNPRGYFESPRFFAALDEMLASARSSWDDWHRLDPQWFDSTAAKGHREQVKALFAEEFGERPLIVVKDPRICRFVPFITSILAELDFDSTAILPLRNPLEVAYSLRRRDTFALSKSMTLWLRHVLDAEYGSRALPRYFMPYEGLLTNWRYHMERAARQMHLAWPDCSKETDANIDEFLALDLRHERASVSELRSNAEVSPWICETYRILGEIAASSESHELLAQLDIIRREFDEACRVLGPTVSSEELVTASMSIVAARVAC